MALTPPPSRPDREYPARPIVGVGAVVVKGDSVIIVQRGTQPGYGTWSIPGGAVELGETVREAVAREVAEECGVEIDITAVVEVLDRVMRDQAGRVQYHYVLIDFVARHTAGELHAGSDVLAARWLSVDHLEQAQLPDITLAVIRKALKLIEEFPSGV